MNIAPEHINDEVVEGSRLDRRHGMKLISFGSSKRSRLRIDLDDNLLRPGKKIQAPQGVGSQKRDLPGGEESSISGIAVVIAALVGLTIGFLVGRRQDS